MNEVKGWASICSGGWQQGVNAQGQPVLVVTTTALHVYKSRRRSGLAVAKTICLDLPGHVKTVAAQPATLYLAYCYHL
jgi:hypothetical protein